MQDSQLLYILPFLRKTKMDFRLILTTLLLIKYDCFCHGLTDVRPSNILVFLPTEARSHFNGFKPLLETLVVRGHNLTLVSPFPLSSIMDDGSPLPYYTYVQVEIMDAVIDIDFLDKNSIINKLPMYLTMQWLGPVITRKALEKKTVKNFILNDNSSFDLVIFENFYHESFVTLGNKYRAPVVQLLPFATNPRVSQWQRNLYDPSYIADFASGYVAPMKFWQRAENTVSAIFNTWITYLFYLPQQRDIMDEYFAYAGYEHRPKLETMLQNVSLTLVNSHPLIAPVAPLIPNYIHVAGMHVKPTKMLPQDLKIITDAANYGLIYFSMGSVIKASKIPKKTVSFLLSEFAKINQTVLWKWENDQLPDLPKNVIVRKWFPQNDILSHPNCQLFITHGGIHSLIESIYHGVPMLSIPVFGDQKHNSVEAEHRGFALHIPYFELTAEDFGEKLRNLLQDPRYGEAVRKASSILRDNPTPIMDKAVFWIEYVIRHKGAPHLRTAANDLYWFQYYLLDVFAAFSLSLVFALYLNYRCISYLLKKVGDAKRTAPKIATKTKRKKQ